MPEAEKVFFRGILSWCEI